MKLKYMVLAATLAILAASVIHADEDYPDEQYYWKGEAQTLREPGTAKAVKKRRHVQKKSDIPASEGQQAASPGGSSKQAKEKGDKEGCEETMSC